MEVIGTIHQKLGFDWAIENFFESTEGRNYYQSPEFTFAESTWCLSLNRSDRNYGTTHLYLSFIKSFDVMKVGPTLRFTMGLKNEEEIIYCRDDIIHCFDEYANIFVTEITHDLHIIRNGLDVPLKKALILFIKDLCIHNSIVDSNTHDSNSTDEKEDSVSSDQKGENGEKEDSMSFDQEGVQHLARNLKDLFVNEEECDITLKMENQEFRANKAILMARSSVFASMFRHDMSEKNTGLVNIPDCGAEAFKELLLYLYSGTVTHSSSDITFDLYEASVKYDLEHLTRKCVLFVKDDMSVDTFCDILAISLKHNEMEIINIATEFFTHHIKNILPTVKWQTFLKENPIATNELLIKAMENK